VTTSDRFTWKAHDLTDASPSGNSATSPGDGQGSSSEMAFTIDDARSYIAQGRWQFAKTMPHIPHWYTLRKWLPELDDAFVSFVLLIRRVGEQHPWPDPPARPRYHHRYLAIDGWKYWTMRAPVHYGHDFANDPAETILINRARVEEETRPPAG